ncbi:hypothetical protein Rhe02_62350 [Rhizocola hellebori]|uniref:Polysaccharide biosynthesis protein C-terminal domain-containing protein n=2 Tax=Rhizocola hellebori TaxID=1392758 RepID=A0A8J3QEI3_9ACTN|nr:hypothetical protein Rhe02_62350 [Rhizocola hellebori]
MDMPPAASPSGVRRGVAVIRASLLSMLAIAALGITRLVHSALVAHGTDESTFTAVGILIGSTMVAGLFLPGGLSSAAAKFIPYHLGRSDVAMARAVYRLLLIVGYACSLALGLVVGAGSLFYGYSGADALSVGLLTVAFSIYSIEKSALYGFDRVESYVRLELIGSVTAIALTVLVVAFGWHAYLMPLTLGYTVLVIGSWLVLRRSTDSTLDNWIPEQPTPHTAAAPITSRDTLASRPSALSAGESVTFSGGAAGESRAFGGAANGSAAASGGAAGSVDALGWNAAGGPGAASGGAGALGSGAAGGLGAGVAVAGGRVVVPRGQRREIAGYVGMASLGGLASAGLLQALPLLAAIYTTPAEVKYFVTAVSLVAPLYFLPRALGMALFPAMAHAHGSGDLESIRRQADLSTRALFVALAPLFVVAIMLARQVLTLIYPPQFADGTVVLQVLLLATYLMVTPVAAINALSSGTPREVRVPVSSAVVGWFAGVGAAIPLGLAFGDVGVGLAYLIAAAVSAAWPLSAVAKRHQLAWFGPIARSVAVVVAGLLVAQVLPHGWLAGIGAAVAGGAIAVALLRRDLRRILGDARYSA